LYDINLAVFTISSIYPVMMQCLYLNLFTQHHNEYFSFYRLINLESLYILYNLYIIT